MPKVTDIPDILAPRVIEKERVRQRAHGHTEDIIPDSRKSLGDFLTFLDHYLRQAQSEYTSHNEHTVDQSYKTLVKIGALVAAFIESHPHEYEVEMCPDCHFQLGRCTCGSTANPVKVLK